MQPFGEVIISDSDDEKLIKELLSKDEGVATLDFKSKAYHLDNDYYKALFIKDIICMANTPRDGSACILIGVHRKPDATKEILGVAEHPDDARLQELISSRVRPVPKFQYRSVQYGGKSLGILEVFPRRGVLSYLLGHMKTSYVKTSFTFVEVHRIARLGQKRSVRLLLG